MLTHCALSAYLLHLLSHWEYLLHSINTIRLSQDCDLAFFPSFSLLKTFTLNVTQAQ